MRYAICLVSLAFCVLALSALPVPLLESFSLAQKPPSFEAWISDLKKEGLAEGISQKTIERALKDLAPIPRVLELDRRQPEFTLTFEEYLNRVVSESRVADGRERMSEHRALLEEVSSASGVQQQFLVALWGIESSFGRITGTFPVIGAVATLAYDGRRSAFFRKELLYALRILDQGHVTADRMIGSWAGATGQFQFMPSSFLHFAVDHDGDGRIDIWDNLGDALASAAHYLVKSGWKKDQNWGWEVVLPQGFDRSGVDLNRDWRLSQWEALGVRLANAGSLPATPGAVARLVEPEGAKGRAFLVQENYRALLRWNRSDFFGLAVGILADRIAAP